MVGWEVLSRPPASEGGGRSPAFTGLATQSYSATGVDGWEHHSAGYLKTGPQYTARRLRSAAARNVSPILQSRLSPGVAENELLNPMHYLLVRIGDNGAEMAGSRDHDRPPFFAETFVKSPEFFLLFSFSART
jgi:hypothetical protein